MMLSEQELEFPKLFSSLLKTLRPLLAISHANKEHDFFRANADAGVSTAPGAQGAPQDAHPEASVDAKPLPQAGACISGSAYQGRGRDAQAASSAASSGASSSLGHAAAALNVPAEGAKTCAVEHEGVSQLQASGRSCCASGGGGQAAGCEADEDEEAFEHSLLACNLSPASCQPSPHPSAACVPLRDATGDMGGAAMGQSGAEGAEGRLLRPRGSGACDWHAGSGLVGLGLGLGIAALALMRLPR